MAMLDGSDRMDFDDAVDDAFDVGSDENDGDQREDNEVDNEMDDEEDDEMDDEEDDEEEDPNDSEQVDDSSKTLYLSLLMLQERHGLTNVAVEDIAKLIHFFFKKVKTSYVTITKHASTFKPTVRKFVYLECCGLSSPIIKPDQRVSCACTSRPPLSVSPNLSYFCSISIKDWLNYLVPKYYDKLRLSQVSLCRGCCQIITI